MIRIYQQNRPISLLPYALDLGLGTIAPLSGTVTEELNGIYELEMEVSTDEKRFAELQVGTILRLPVNDMADEQLFRIYEVTTPLNKKATVKACHISYDLNKVVVMPFTATGITQTLSKLSSDSLNLGEFVLSTDIVNTASVFTNEIPRYFRECLGGYEGSILDVFRCEYEWDNALVRFLSRRGADNGVRIAYGKNLTDYRQEENNENVYTSVVGYAVVEDVTYTGNVYHKVVAQEPRIKIVDFSSDYMEGQIPTTADLTTKAQAYATANAIEVPRVNIEVSFVPLWQADGYRNLASVERVQLGDTVHVDFSKMGVTATARVTRTEWDIVKNRYTSIELGDAKANLTDVIDSTVNSAIEEYDHKFDGVTGVKGSAEADYRTGNVSISPADIGLTATSDLTDDSIFPYRGVVTDYNDAEDTGMYTASANASNMPGSDAATTYRIIVYEVNGVVYQIAVRNGTNDSLYWRNRASTLVWSAWRQFANKDDVADLTQVSDGSTSLTWNSSTSQIATKTANVLYSVNGIAWLYLNFTTGSSFTSGMNIATIPTGYRPKSGAFYSLTNLTTRTSPGICVMNTNGTINFSANRGSASSQYVLVASYVLA